MTIIDIMVANINQKVKQDTEQYYGSIVLGVLYINVYRDNFTIS